MRNVFTKFAATLLTVTVCALLVSPAHASLVISSSVLGGPSLATDVNYVNFDNLVPNAGGFSPNLLPQSATTGGIGVTFTPDGESLDKPVSGIAAPPFVAGLNDTPFTPHTPYSQANPDADTTVYLTSGATPATASLTLTFPASTYLGLLWGSVDTYNSLTLYYTDGTSEVITGTQALDPAIGDQGLGGSTYVNITSTDKAFNKAVATSNGQYAFELDNVAYNGVPEATTIVVWSGLSLIGLLAHRRRSKLRST